MRYQLATTILVVDSRPRDIILFKALRGPTPPPASGPPRTIRCRREPLMAASALGPGRRLEDGGNW